MEPESESSSSSSSGRRMYSESDSDSDSDSDHSAFFHLYANPEAPADFDLPEESTVDKAFVLLQLRKLIPWPQANGKKEGASALADKKNNENESREKHSDLSEFSPQEREEACCLLWDLTVEPQLCELLLKHEALLPLSYWLSHPKKCSSRLLEAALGTLANMASADARMASAIAAFPGLTVGVMELAMGQKDPQLLAELCRLIAVSLSSSQAAREPWLQVLEETARGFVFMLQSTLNAALFDRLCSLFEQIVWHTRENTAFELLAQELFIALCTLLPTELSSAASESESNLTRVLSVLDGLASRPVIDVTMSRDADFILLVAKCVSQDDCTAIALSLLVSLLEDSPHCERVASEAQLMSVALDNASDSESAWALLAILAAHTPSQWFHSHSGQLLAVAKNSSAERSSRLDALGAVLAQVTDSPELYERVARVREEIANAKVELRDD